MVGANVGGGGDSLKEQVTIQLRQRRKSEPRGELREEARRDDQRDNDKVKSGVGIICRSNAGQDEGE